MYSMYRKDQHKIEMKEEIYMVVFLKESTISIIIVLNYDGLFNVCVLCVHSLVIDSVYIVHIDYQTYPGKKVAADHCKTRRQAPKGRNKFWLILRVKHILL